MKYFALTLLLVTTSAFADFDPPGKVQCTTAFKTISETKAKMNWEACKRQGIKCPNFDGSTLYDGATVSSSLESKSGDIEFYQGYGVIKPPGLEGTKTGEGFSVDFSYRLEAASASRTERRIIFYARSHSTGTPYTDLTLTRGFPLADFDDELVFKKGGINIPIKGKYRDERLQEFIVTCKLAK